MLTNVILTESNREYDVISLREQQTGNTCIQIIIISVVESMTDKVLAEYHYGTKESPLIVLSLNWFNSICNIRNMQYYIDIDVLFSDKEKMSSSSLASPDPMRKSNSTNISSTKASRSIGDSGDVSQSKDQCNPDADLNNSYLNLENIFEAGGENNEEGSLEV